jgi:hypothetical protein
VHSPLFVWQVGSLWQPTLRGACGGTCGALNEPCGGLDKLLPEHHAGADEVPLAHDGVTYADGCAAVDAHSDRRGRTAVNHEVDAGHAESSTPVRTRRKKNRRRAHSET